MLSEWNYQPLTEEQKEIKEHLSKELAISPANF